MVLDRNKNSPYYKKFVNVRHLEDNMKELFRTFRNNSAMCFKTFYNYKRKYNIYKKAQRLTDLCDYCEQKRKLLIETSKSFLKYNDYKPKPSIDIKEMIKFLKKKFKIAKEKADNQEVNYISSLIMKLKDLEAFSFHKQIALQQRTAYNFQKSNHEFLRDKILIDMDYKQKITIGLSPRQVNAEYFAQFNSQRSCLGLLEKFMINKFKIKKLRIKIKLKNIGFGIYFLKNDSINKINFDIISDDIEQGGYQTVRGLRILKEQPFFQGL